MNVKLSEKSKELLYLLAEDAENWGGSPLLPELTPEQKGNLSDLVKKNILEIDNDEWDKDSWVEFTEEGKNLINNLFDIEIED